MGFFILGGLVAIIGIVFFMASYGYFQEARYQWKFHHIKSCEWDWFSKFLGGIVNFSVAVLLFYFAFFLTSVIY